MIRNVSAQLKKNKLVILRIIPAMKQIINSETQLVKLPTTKYKHPYQAHQEDSNGLPSLGTVLHNLVKYYFTPRD